MEGRYSARISTANSREASESHWLTPDYPTASSAQKVRSSALAAQHDAELRLLQSPEGRSPSRPPTAGGLRDVIEMSPQHPRWGASGEEGGRIGHGYDGSNTTPHYGTPVEEPGERSALASARSIDSSHHHGHSYTAAPHADGRHNGMPFNSTQGYGYRLPLPHEGTREVADHDRLPSSRPYTPMTTDSLGSARYAAGGGPPARQTPRGPAVLSPTANKPTAPNRTGSPSLRSAYYALAARSSRPANHPKPASSGNSLGGSYSNGSYATKGAPQGYSTYNNSSSSAPTYATRATPQRTSSAAFRSGFARHPTSTSNNGGYASEGGAYVRGQSPSASRRLAHSPSAASSNRNGRPLSPRSSSMALLAATEAAGGRLTIAQRRRLQKNQQQQQHASGAVGMTRRIGANSMNSNSNLFSDRLQALMAVKERMELLATTHREEEAALREVLQGLLKMEESGGGTAGATSGPAGGAPRATTGRSVSAAHDPRLAAAYQELEAEVRRYVDELEAANAKLSATVAERDKAIGLLDTFQREGSKVIESLHDSVKRVNDDNVKLLQQNEALRLEKDRLKGMVRRVTEAAAVTRDASGSESEEQSPTDASEDAEVSTPKSEAGSDEEGGDAVPRQRRPRRTPRDPAKYIPIALHDEVVRDYQSLLAEADEMLSDLRVTNEALDRKVAQLEMRVESYQQGTPEPEGSRGDGTTTNAAGPSNALVPREEPSSTEVADATVPTTHPSSRTRMEALLTYELRAEKQHRLEAEEHAHELAQQHQRHVALLEQRLAHVTRLLYGGNKGGGGDQSLAASFASSTPLTPSHLGPTRGMEASPAPMLCLGSEEHTPRTGGDGWESATPTTTCAEGDLLLEHQLSPFQRRRMHRDAALLRASSAAAATGPPQHGGALRALEDKCDGVGADEPITADGGGSAALTTLASVRDELVNGGEASFERDGDANSDSLYEDIVVEAVVNTYPHPTTHESSYGGEAAEQGGDQHDPREEEDEETLASMADDIAADLIC